LRIEIRLRRRKLDSARGEDDRQRLPHLRVQVGEQFLGQHDASGIADFGDLEGCVHTGVITRQRGVGNLWLRRGS